MFIQEHWMSETEAADNFNIDFQNYDFLTTSMDTFALPEDMLQKSGPSWHGTALGWHSSLSSFVSKLPIVSSRFCGIKFKNEQITIISYSVYLPTSGQDDDFLDEISLLTHDIESNASVVDTIVIGIDANTSIKSSKRRQRIFSEFLQNFSLETILPGDDPTFHHNNGYSESQIDHILTNNREIINFHQQLCKHDDEINLSSHDAIIGSIKILNSTVTEETDYTDTYEDFNPKKIIWKKNPEYEEVTANILKDLLDNFNQPEHLPALGEMCSNMIALSAEKLFETKETKNPQKRNTPKFSLALREAYSEHKRICSEWRKSGRPVSTEHPAKAAKINSQRNIQKISREDEAQKTKQQHEDLMDTHGTNISRMYKKLEKIRGAKCKQISIEEIETFHGKYTGNNVLEGFRANAEYLCNEKSETEFSEKFLNQCSEDLMIIHDISEEEALEIPPITLEALKDIIFKKLKTNKACDIYKLTTEHLRYSGDEVLTQLKTLINRVLENLSFLTAPEFKIAIASVIHKGKDKPRNHHKSYRFVRVCPLIGRIIDEHIRPMAVQISKPLQSPSQYGFTDKIAYLMGALQRNEAQKHCIDKKTTFFGCSLDGDSAFEVVSRIIQKRELYFSGEKGKLSKYNEGSYKNTQTRIKMNGKLSQPLNEYLGVGQGKIRSSDHYKIYINPVLETLEKANLGVNIGPINTGISCVADDLYLLTDDQVKLQGLLDICQHYGNLYRVKYGAAKTVISVVGSKKDMAYYDKIHPWTMNSQTVSVRENNEHLGLIVSGLSEEEKNIDLKIKKARGALFKLLGPVLSAKCHLSPAVQTHIYRVYICPIARSGLAAMTLRDSHTKPLTAFHRKILRGFLRISDRAPISALYFLTGELPITAKLHRDAFSLFFSIWINPQTKIHKIVCYLLENSPKDSHTWSRHLRNLAQKYDIEDPAITIKKTPPSHKEYSQYILTKITVYHEKELRAASQNNSKMVYLNVNVKGLSGRPHKALQGVTTVQGVQKMRSHLKMLCSDTYTYEIKALYQGGSPLCRLCTGYPNGSTENENITHIVTQCDAYSDLRSRILHQMELICASAKTKINFKQILANNKELCQFILDCTSLNLSTRISEEDDICPRLFALSRDLCFGISKLRSQKLKLMQ